MSTHPTHVIIFAATNLQREAWCAMLRQQPEITVIGSVGDLSSIAAYIPKDQKTTILIDKPEPELAWQLHQINPHCGLLFLVGAYDLPEIFPLIQAGATGCLDRNASVGDLARAMIAAGRGEIVLPADIAVQALSAMARGKTVGYGPAEPLSEREVEVLKLLAQGLTNKDIAQTLFLSVRTIEAHLRSIFAKLSVQSRTEAALWAVKYGYGPDENR